MDAIGHCLRPRCHRTPAPRRPTAPPNSAAPQRRPTRAPPQVTTYSAQMLAWGAKAVHWVPCAPSTASVALHQPQPQPQPQMPQPQMPQPQPQPQPPSLNPASNSNYIAACGRYPLEMLRQGEAAMVAYLRGGAV